MITIAAAHDRIEVFINPIQNESSLGQLIVDPTQNIQYEAWNLNNQSGSIVSAGKAWTETAGAQILTY